MRIVVGYDGSESARAAVDYAGRRAGADGTVFVVTAYGPPPDWLGHREYDRIVAQHRAHGNDLLESLMGVRDWLPPADYELELLEGPAAEALERVADTRGADEIVVGSRGRGRVRGALGSVSHALLRDARRPVVVMPPAPEES